MSYAEKAIIWVVLRMRKFLEAAHPLLHTDNSMMVVSASAQIHMKLQSRPRADFLHHDFPPTVADFSRVSWARYDPGSLVCRDTSGPHALVRLIHVLAVARRASTSLLSE